METIVIKGGRLIDGTGSVPVDESVVVIEGNTIKQVGRNVDVNLPGGDKVKVIDADGKTVMPGLVDSHVHIGLGGESGEFLSIPIKNNSIDIAMRGVAFLRKTLEMGITTLRDGGSGYDWMEVSLRDAINRGDIVGPRFIATGYHLTVTGGHGYFLPPWLGKFAPPQQIGMHCNGADEWRKAARLNIYNGTDCVKLVASRGFLSSGLTVEAPPTASQATLEELTAAVEEGHKMGKKVFAHANGPEAIKKSVEAGVDSIVHGFYIDEESAEMMVDRNVTLEPTALVIGVIKDFGQGKMPDVMVEKARDYWKLKKREIEMVLDKGVRISLSSDMGCPFLLHGENARELSLLVELGMSPMDAIVAATQNAAETVGLGKEVGTLEEGKIADIILVDGDPSDNIDILHDAEKIKLVMKEGEIVRSNIS